MSIRGLRTYLVISREPSGEALSSVDCTVGPEERRGGGGRPRAASRAEEGVPPGEGSCDKASPAPAATAVPADIARLAVQISALASSDRARAPEILPLQGSSDLCRPPQICYSAEKGSGYILTPGVAGVNGVKEGGRGMEGTWGKRAATPGRPRPHSS